MGILETEDKQKVAEKEGLLVPRKTTKAEIQAYCRVRLTGSFWAASYTGTEYPQLSNAPNATLWC